jgi:hypothetical protein
VRTAPASAEDRGGRGGIRGRLRLRPKPLDNHSLHDVRCDLQEQAHGWLAWSTLGEVYTIR